MGETYLTRKGHQKLFEELQYLKTVKRRELSKAIGEARAHGDISENAEYDAAKDAQGMNEKRIAELEAKLSSCRILDDENISSDEVLIGATVSLVDLDSKEELTYTLVSEVEADYSQNQISVTSPVGEGLLNHKVNEVVQIQIPAGTLRYKILKISRGFALLEMLLVLLIALFIFFKVFNTYFKKNPVDNETKKALSEQGIDTGNYKSIIDSSRDVVRDLNKEAAKRAAEAEAVSAR